MENMDNYESNVFNIDEIGGQDIKLTASFYLHTGILKSQQALINPDIDAGFRQYRMIVENMEAIANADELLTEKYRTGLKDYINSKEITDEEDKNVRMMKIAHKKIELILKEVFDGKPIKGPIKG